MADILGKGKRTAKTAKKLASYLGLKTTRELAKVIQQERRNGAPICATNSFPVCGYYLAETKEEMLSFCSSLLRRAKEIERTRKACLLTVEKLPSTQEVKEE